MCQVHTLVTPQTNRNDCLVLNTHSHQLLVQTHKAQLLSPLELLHKLRISQLRNLVIPHRERQRLQQPIHDGHHVSPRTSHNRGRRALPVPGGLVVLDEDGFSADRNGHHDSIDHLVFRVIGDFVQQKERQSTRLLRTPLTTPRRRPCPPPDGASPHLPRCTRRGTGTATFCGCRMPLGSA